MSRGRGRAVAAPLLRAVAVATLAAGVVGTLRQARESRAVRAGLRPGTGPDGDPVPRRAPGTVAARLGDWVPPPPRTALGRAAAGLWAAPLTAVGVAVALAGGRTPRHDPERACWIATGVGGPSRAALGAVGAAANTIGRVVLVRGAIPGPALLDHEAVHVRQAERLGPLLPVAYAWLGARYGYADNPLERAARAGARRAATLRRDRGAG